MSNKNIRCIDCGTWIDYNDMLKHGIEVHNRPMAKTIQRKLDELNIEAKKLGLAHMEIKDILSEKEVKDRLRYIEKEKEKLR